MMKKTMVLYWGSILWVGLMIGLPVRIGWGAGNGLTPSGERELDRVISAAMDASSTPGTALALIEGGRSAV